MLTQLVETQEESQTYKSSGHFNEATKIDQNSKLLDSYHLTIWNVANEARHLKSENQQAVNSRQEASNGSIQLFTEVATL